MVNFINTVKNSAIIVNSIKNSVASFTDVLKSHNAFQYIMTDTPDYVLVGLAEDEFLIWDTPTAYINLIKS